ncbi:MAG: hypothetical protein R3D57_13880 [Hyphomicrobiaceae bacterium]
MADDKTDPSGRKPGSEAPDPKKPTATLDLKATVIETRDMPKTGAEAAERTQNKPADPKPGEKKPEAASGASGAKDAKPSDAKSDAPGSPEAAARSGPAKPPSGPAGPTRRSGGFVSHAIAGIAGALIAMFGVNALSDRLGLGSQSVEELTNRIAALEAEIKEQAADSSESTLRDKIARVEADLRAAGGWKEKLAALEAEQKKVADAAAATKAELAGLAAKPAGEATMSTAVAERLDVMEKQLDTMAEASKKGEGGSIAGLAALTGRISDFEAELQSRVDGVKKGFEERLVKEVAGLDSRLAEGLTAGSGATVQIATLKEGNLRLGRDIEGLKLTTERLQQGIDSVRGATEEIRSEVVKLADADSQAEKSYAQLVANLNTQLGQRVTTDDLTKSLEPIGAKLSALEGDVGTLKTNESNRAEAANRILLSLELTSLRRAIERGGSFAKELASVTAIAPKDLDLGPLAAHAEAGLPSIASLKSSFPAAANAALDVERSGDPDASVLDQLWDGAQSIVRVRRTGEVAGDTTEAIVARMEQRLEASDLDGVSREAASLADGPKAAMAGWLGEVEARLAVDRSLAAIEDGLKTLIGSAAGDSGTN